MYPLTAANVIAETRRSRVRKKHQPIDRGYAVGTAQHRGQIELQQPRSRSGSERRYCADHMHQSVTVYRRSAAHTVQQRGS